MSAAPRLLDRRPFRRMTGVICQDGEPPILGDPREPKGTFPRRVVGGVRVTFVTKAVGRTKARSVGLLIVVEVDFRFPVLGLRLIGSMVLNDCLAFPVEPCQDERRVFDRRVARRAIYDNFREARRCRLLHEQFRGRVGCLLDRSHVGVGVKLNYKPIFHVVNFADRVGGNVRFEGVPRQGEDQFSVLPRGDLCRPLLFEDSGVRPMGTVAFL